MTPSDITYGDLLQHNARTYGSAPALVADGQEISHEQLLEHVHALARWLSVQGVAAGDRLAVLAGNRPQVLQILGAAALLGVTLVLLNTRASGAETRALIEDCAPRLVFADPALEHLLDGVSAELSCHALGTASGRLLAWPQGTDAMPVLPDVAASLPLAGIPTAAVGGRPRIALLSHTAVMHQAMQLSLTWTLGPEDRHLCVLPLFHVAGLGTALAVQLAGGASVLMDRFDAAVAARWIDEWQITCFTSFAPILASILDHAEARSARLDSLRAVTGLEPPDVVARLTKHCPRVVFWSGYGQTETAGLVSLAPYELNPGFAGRPLPTVALCIEAGDGQIAGVDEPGEILVRGPVVFSGYWQRPDESRHAARGGWHHTGDLGRLDGQGRLWYLGRAPDKLLIKSGGENIYPAEVEQALLSHPAIEAAVVLGVPDARWGEAVRAVCVCKAGASVAEAELIAHVAQRIARFKKPREVVFVPFLPQGRDGQWDRAAVAASHGT